MSDSLNSSRCSSRRNLSRKAKPRYDMNDNFDLGKLGQNLFNVEDPQNEEPLSKKMVKSIVNEEEQLLKPNANSRIKITSKKTGYKTKKRSPSVRSHEMKDNKSKQSSPKSNQNNTITNYFEVSKSKCKLGRISIDSLDSSSEWDMSQFKSILPSNTESKTVIEGTNGDGSIDSILEFDTRTFTKKSKSKTKKKKEFNSSLKLSRYETDSESQTLSQIAKKASEKEKNSSQDTKGVKAESETVIESINGEGSINSILECDTGTFTKKSKTMTKKELKLPSDESDSDSQTLSQIAKKVREKKPYSSQEETKGAKAIKPNLLKNSKVKVEPEEETTTWLNQKKGVPSQKHPPSNQRNQKFSDAEFMSQFPKAKPMSKSRHPPTKEEETTNDINDKSPVKNKVRKTTKSTKPLETDSHKQSLDMISKMVKEIEKQKLERLKFQEMEKQLKEHGVVITCSPNLVQARERITEMNNLILDSTILEKPPGLRFINCQEYHCYYHNISDLDDFELNKILPKILSYMGKNFDFLDLSSAKTLDKLFKVVSYLNDDDAIKVSYVLEAGMMKHQDWLPKIRHIVVALLNYGITVDNCPYQELFINHKLKLFKIDESDRDIFGEALSLEDKEKKIQCANNLFLMLEILISCFEKGRTYVTVDLCHLIVIFLWIRMEWNYLDHLVVKKILKFCSLALDGIKETMFPDYVDYISNKLVQLDPECNHHNMAFLAEFLPDTPRGNQLRRATSFKTLLVIYGKPIPKLEEDVNVEKVYHLVKQYGIRYNTENFHETNSIISLISFCLNLDGNSKKEPPQEIMYLKKLANMLYTYSVPIVDSIKQQDTTRIKNSLLGLRCKVALYYSGMDVKEASLERLMDDTNFISPVRRRHSKKGVTKKQLFKDSSISQ